MTCHSRNSIEVTVRVRKSYQRASIHNTKALVLAHLKKKRISLMLHPSLSSENVFEKLKKIQFLSNSQSTPLDWLNTTSCMLSVFEIVKLYYYLHTLPTTWLCWALFALSCLPTADWELDLLVNRVPDYFTLSDWSALGLGPA